MSRLLPNPPAASGPVWEHVPVRRVSMGSGSVLRAIPHRNRRTIGPWCFLDHAGASEGSIFVASHPHCGLQTVSWLIEGEIEHRDSLGTVQMLRAGELNLMTSGSGLCHVETSQPGRHHLVQLWIALPAAKRGIDPMFEHHADLPKWAPASGVEVTLLLGEMGDHTSPGSTFWPTIGADIVLAPGATCTLPLDPEHEHGLYVCEGSVTSDAELGTYQMAYLGRGRPEVELTAGPEGARVMLVGGEPYPDLMLMSWNFVVGSHDEAAQVARQWNQRERFGDVPGYEDQRIPAPVKR